MLSIKEQLALVYCLTDDGLKSGNNGGKWRKSNHNPKCTRAKKAGEILSKKVTSIISHNA